eukprot:GHVS01047827.1.p1 GENE.GHVS01047827.1~~GHVS01047827.1.p1  ORF type:complete len:140 (+),score=20.35 GHVS01047827.1:335-754(+)
MASGTVPTSGYSKLLVSPTPTPSGPPVKLLPSMRFDEDVFERSYHMCRGGGHDNGYCANRFVLGGQTHRYHNTQELFTKELVDAVECMSYLGPTPGDSNRCQHYIEGLHKILHHQPPNPTKTQKLKSFFGKFRSQEIQA